MKSASPAARSARPLLIALVALVGACGKDKVTALDVRFDITGEIDQVRIDAVSLGGSAVSLAGEQKFFPMPPHLLKTDDVLTIWFDDSADRKTIVVEATGFRCGREVTQVTGTAPPQTLAKGQTVETTLTLVNTTIDCNVDGGADGGGGTTGAGGSVATGGRGGTTGAAGTGGGGAGGAAGTGAAGTGGVAGSAGGAAGRGGTGGGAGASGTGGAAGRGGTTGTAGTGGGAGRGGTTGSAGTGGAAGRGGTTGAAGTTGAGANCATPPAETSAVINTMPMQAFTTCGYQEDSQSPGSFVFTLTFSDYYAFVNLDGFSGGIACGRCAQFSLTGGGTPKSVIVTVVGGCDSSICPLGMPRFALSASAMEGLAPGQASLPATGQTLTYSFVPCPTPGNATIFTNFRMAGSVGKSVLFVRQRYGIKTAQAEVMGGATMPLLRGTDSYWTPPAPNDLGTGSVLFRLTDVNDVQVSFTASVSATASATIAQFPLCTP